MARFMARFESKVTGTGEKVRGHLVHGQEEKRQCMCLKKCKCGEESEWEICSLHCIFCYWGQKIYFVCVQSKNASRFIRKNLLDLFCVHGHLVIPSFQTELTGEVVHYWLWVNRDVNISHTSSPELKGTVETIYANSLTFLSRPCQYHDQGKVATCQT